MTRKHLPDDDKNKAGSRIKSRKATKVAAADPKARREASQQQKKQGVR